MKHQLKIKHILLKALCSVVLPLVLCLFAASDANAVKIVCGSGYNNLCDTEKRQCIKVPNVCLQYTTMYSPSAGIATDTCAKYGDDYRCISKDEAKPETAVNINVSTTSEGKVLTGEDEKRALRVGHDAKLTNYEKQEAIKESYTGLEEIKTDNITDYISTISNDDNKSKLKDIEEDVEKLRKYTTADGYKEAISSPGDTKMLDTFQDAMNKLNDLLKKKQISEDQYHQLKQDISALYNTAVQRVAKAAEASENKEQAQEVRKELAEATMEYSLAECPSSAQLKARYYAGCWSCLVIEKMTSSFLWAADKGLKITQKAGLTLLWLGTAIWIVFWGLKNVSSFTQIQLGNILNDLIKFLFKVAIAYWFIFYSSTAISKYFITPMMSVGSIIAQQFWPQEIEEFVSEWDDAEPVEDLQTVVEEAKKESAEEISKNQITTEVTTPEQQEMLKAAEQLEIHEGADSDIPAFITPGVPGHISSYPGCRKPFKTSNGKMGSKSHMGLDVGGNNMAPVTAIAGGTITYSGDASTGWGLKAMITTEHKGNTWIHLYGHMNPKTYYQFKSQKNGRKVVRGEQIGNVGTTGNSTGPHLHLEVQLTGKVGGYNYKQAYLDPISLGQGKIVPRAYKYDEATKTFTFYKARCNGTFVDPIPPTGYAKGAKLPAGGFSSNGKAGLDLSDTYIMDGNGGGYSASVDYDSLVVKIPEVKYTGPTNILPKSVMNSILGATRAITNTTANVMIMGNMIMCYASAKNGGAWAIETDILKFGYWTNIFLWLEGVVIWCLGFMLTMAIAYYLVDISFKMGFAVLSIPLMMGLWPFGLTQNKIFIAISIIAKSAAIFAFLALTTAFGMRLVGEAAGGLEELFTGIDDITQGLVEVDEEIRARVHDKLRVSSPTFILVVFAILYFYKLVQQTISDLVNKFFPDQAFGDSSPMHSGATMATSFAKKFAMKASGLDLAKDIVAHQTGQMVKTGLHKAGKAASYPIRHPMKSARAAAHGIKKGFNKLRGKK